MPEPMSEERLKEIEASLLEFRGCPEGACATVGLELVAEVRRLKREVFHANDIADAASGEVRRLREGIRHSLNRYPPGSFAVAKASLLRLLGGEEDT